jgi:TolB-like protein/class 3 adenylate cyclase/Flp pilus assembly protein TadD
MTPKDVKRKLTAILSADVKEYSRLMTQDEVGTIRTLTAYKEAMSSLIQQYRGRVVDAPGDNLMAEFASVVDAVNCAVEIQRELAERNTELPYDRQMEFRIGINLGDVVEEEDRIYGDGVNIAARVESLAEGGGICISGKVYEEVKGKLGLEYEYLGEQAIKNIPEPVRVYRVLSFPGAAARRVIQAKSATERKWRKAALALAAILVLGAGAALIWNFYLRSATPPAEVASEERMAFPLPDKPSIAVLPFVNLSEDPKQEYFADGMTEDLITDLSKISGLFVIARNSTFTYKGKPVKIRQVAEELGVRYVLEGSVRRADDRVRINTQLIDATTGGHLWAERYDGNIGDVFALQDKITQKIVTALVVKLTPGEQEYVVRKETENTVAYDTLLKGWEHYRRFTPDDFAKALSYFEKAIELDPNYGRAHAALAQTYWRGLELGWRWQMGLGVGWAEGRILARKYLQTAMKYPTTSLVHQVASAMNLFRRKYDEAIYEANRAIALDPNDHRSHWIMAWALIYAGSPEDAVEFAKTAMRLDPHYAAPNLFLLGLAYFAMGQMEEAVNMFERAITHNPELRGLSAPLAAAYAHLGRDQEARLALVYYRNEWSWWGWSPDLLRVMQFFPFKDPEVADRLADGLLKAGLPGQTSGYCKVSHEHKLIGEKIRPLVFGRTLTGLSPLTRLEWRIHRTKDGKISYRGNWPFTIMTPGESGSGTSWIEGDMLYDQWENIFRGLKYHMAVYRNLDGTPEMKNEYFFVTDFGIFPWSPVD